MATPNIGTIEQVCQHLAVTPEQTLKTLLVEGVADDAAAPPPLVALVLRGDHVLNPIKAAKIAGVQGPLKLATAEAVKKATGAAPGSVGPVNTPLRVIADHSAAHLADFVCGANADGEHLTGVNWGRDLPEPETADLRNVVAGDYSPAGNPIAIARGIEVGHIFQLGSKYTESMGAKVLDQNGRQQPMLMGCYGIGISRIVAAAIEQNYDERGIVWPEPLAPFRVLILALNARKSAEVRSFADELYATLQAQSIAVVLDDRDTRPGVMFADADLLGIPHQVVIGDRGLGQGMVEYKHRRSGESRELEVAKLEQFLAAQLSAG